MKVGFVGCGKMAEAMISSFIDSRILKAHEIFASDISADRRHMVKRRHGINVYSKNNVVVETAEIVFFAVKPQDLNEVITEIASHITKNHLVVSIVAGKKISSIQSMLPMARVIRVMPNLACLVSEGMSVFCTSPKVTVSDRKTAIRLLSCFGKVLELPEDQFDAVTALSGSGPAFFAYLLDRMIDAGVKEGLDRKNALLLAEQTMLGTSRLLIENGIDPKDIIVAVASAKGTTAAGLAVLERSDISTILHDTIKMAVKRSKELSA